MQPGTFSEHWAAYPLANGCVSTHNHRAEMRCMLKRSDRPLFALGFKICTGWLDHKWTAEAHRHLNLCHLCLDLINVKGSSAPLLHASVTSEETDYILASASTMFQGPIYMYEENDRAKSFTGCKKGRGQDEGPPCPFSGHLFFLCPCWRCICSLYTR